MTGQTNVEVTQADRDSEAVAQQAGCVNHPDNPVRETLDGDPLCQECCVAWVRGERPYPEDTHEN